MADPPHTEQDEQSLVLPMGRKEFGDFISGLLGQRRTIERNFGGRTFLIDMNWLQNIAQIIEQRIAAQNAGKLVSYSARIFFSDGRIITLNSREALATFNDHSSCITVGVDINWTYLISFPMRSMPAKQDIRFRAFTNKKALIQKLPREWTPSLLGDSDEGIEELSFSIQFSDVTWGEDISSHLSNFIETNSKRQNMVTRVMRKLSSSVISFLALFGSMLFSNVDLSRQFHSMSVELAKKYGADKLSLIKIPQDKKLDFIVDATIAQMNSSDSGLSFSIFMLKFFFYGICIVILCYLLKIRKPSVIQLNNYSHEFYRSRSGRYEFIKYGIIVALVVGIVAGVFSNRLYDLIKPMLGLT